MSGKRRRHGIVEPPLLSDLISPHSDSAAKKPRLDTNTDPDPPLSLSQWTVQNVTDYLRKNGLDDNVSETFEANDISGRHLLRLTVEDLKDLGIASLGVRKDVMSLISSLTKMKLTGREKVFNDPIHGHIALHPLMIKIIDTPQFQRLRKIKQLGGSYYVFMGAAHNRFEHSIGVGYLAGELVSMLQSKQPELSITDIDILCVKIAGLCHDLGHGPFSHMWDSMFIPKAVPGTTWKHEEASVMMFDHLIHSNGLLQEVEKYGLTETDLTFIKEQIAGPLESEMSSQVFDWPYVGRTKDKSFLYEVVANKRNGMDVDKWDYFVRDCHSLGIPTNFDLRRFMTFARVLEVNDRRQICTRDKEVGNLYEMFHTRNSLHRRAYQHKTSNIVEYMLTEAFLKADQHLTLRERQPVRMSESIRDPIAYTRLTDHIVDKILDSPDPALSESQKILKKIEKRQLYKCVGQTAPPPGRNYNKSEAQSIACDIIRSLTAADLGELSPLTHDDLVVDIVTFDYGMREENPIDHMRFYMKDNPGKAVKVRKDQVSEMLPHKFREQSVRVYCKLLDKKSLEAALKYFLAWCRKQSCVTPKGACSDPLMDMEDDDFTPYSTPYTTPLKSDEEHKHMMINESLIKKLFTDS